MLTFLVEQIGITLRQTLTYPTALSLTTDQNSTWVRQQNEIAWHLIPDPGCKRHRYLHQIRFHERKKNQSSKYIESLGRTTLEQPKYLTKQISDIRSNNTRRKRLFYNSFKIRNNLSLLEKYNIEYAKIVYISKVCLEPRGYLWTTATGTACLDKFSK